MPTDYGEASPDRDGAGDPTAAAADVFKEEDEDQLPIRQLENAAGGDPSFSDGNIDNDDDDDL